MNPVSLTNPNAAAGSATMPPLGATVAPAAKPGAFRLLLLQDAGSLVSGTPASRASVASPGATPLVDGASLRAHDSTEEAGGAGAHRSSWARESFDPRGHRYFGAQADLAAWLPVAPSPSTQVAPFDASRSAASLEELLPALVRRVAWSSDGNRGTARLEIGSGELAGATLLVHANEGRVRVQLDAPPGADLHAWRQRILERLTSRDIAVDEVEVS
jgi:hypothetical protein